MGSRQAGTEPAREGALKRRLEPPRLELRIEALALHGFSSAEREALLTSFQSELGKLVAERGLPRTAPIHLRRLRVDGAPAASAREAGREAARVLYAKLRFAIDQSGER